MNDKNLDFISLNMCDILKHDQNGELIYPGDILIHANKHFSINENKFSDFILKFFKNKKNKLEFLSENSEFLNFIDILPINYTLFSLADDIIVAEYFNVKDIQNPILSFRGICQSMTFNFNRYYGRTSYPFSNDDIIDETVRFYRHLSDEEANNDRVIMSLHLKILNY